MQRKTAKKEAHPGTRKAHRAAGVASEMRKKAQAGFSMIAFTLSKKITRIKVACARQQEFETRTKGVRQKKGVKKAENERE